MNRIPVKVIRNVFIAGNSFESLRDRKLDYRSFQDCPAIFLEKNTSTRTFMDDSC